MNSREKRKIEAQQHNDAIDYERWLKKNAIYSRVESIDEWRKHGYRKARSQKLPRSAALALASYYALSVGALTT
jgi:hypothetical protein